MFKFFCKHECLLVLYERNGNVREKVIESMEKYFNKSKNQGWWKENSESENFLQESISVYFK